MNRVSVWIDLIISCQNYMWKECEWAVLNRLSWLFLSKGASIEKCLNKNVDTVFSCGCCGEPDNQTQWCESWLIGKMKPDFWLCYDRLILHSQEAQNRELDTGILYRLNWRYTVAFRIHYPLAKSWRIKCSFFVQASTSFKWGCLWALFIHITHLSLTFRNLL